MKRIIKMTFTIVIVAFLLCIVLVGSYVGYVSMQYYRIDDLQEIMVENNKEGEINADGTFSAITYNIGFGAYNHDFSFFMDKGTMLNGEEVAGSNSKAASKDVVLLNTNGALATVSEYDADFYLFQEVDTKSTRSHKVNQFEILKNLGNDYSASYAVNFHSAFLLYPFNDFHGKSNSGISTFSKYDILSSTRYSFPVDDSFPNKFFDLDRCFMLSRLPMSNGKQLVMINLHMSAYDEGGSIRALQLARLNQILAEEYQKGNYVIAGGDFNHDIANSLNSFATEQEVPEWVFVLTDNDLAEGFSFAAPTNAPTCRSTDMPYVKGVNYSVVLDGFIVSDNISVTNVTTIDNDFLYSDHNPVRLEFSFN